MAVSLFQSLDSKAVGLAFLLGLTAILTALASQIFGGLSPCELCLEQRLSYYWGLPLLVLILSGGRRLSLPIWYLAITIATAIFIWSIYMGVFHAGVEWGFWPGPTACTGIGMSIDFSTLDNMQPVIGCDVVQFRFLGLSMAGYNALVSLAIVVLLAASAIARWNHKRP